MIGFFVNKSAIICFNKTQHTKNNKFSHYKRMQHINFQQQPIPTIRQIHRQLVQSYEQLNQTFINIGVSNLPQSEDLELKKISINKVLKQIPTEERLETIQKQASKDEIKNKLLGYTGDYSLIHTAKENFNQIKKQQQLLYYLAAKCELPSVSVEFSEKNVANLEGLASYKDVSEVKSTKVKTLQKNCLSLIYLNEGNAELDTKIEAVVKSSKKSPELKKLDLLVHINYYDSHNSEKQYEFVCHQEQSLTSLVQKLKCLIDTLGKVQTLRNKNECQTENQQIYDKFYKPIQNHLRPESSHQPSEGLRYLAIEDAIYFEGNRSALEPLLNKALHKNQHTLYRCHQISKTKITDLRVVFGRPYLYRHLEGCDHIVIFKQARLFMGNDQFNHDIINLDKYPITVFESKMKRRKCEGCSECFAEIVSIADELKKGENLFLCKVCHENLHFDENGFSKNGQRGKFINYIHD